MIIVQSWRGTVPAGSEWTMTLAAGREHYLFGEHDSLYARCSGLFRQSLWLGQIGPPPVCKSMSMSMLPARRDVLLGKCHGSRCCAASLHHRRWALCCLVLTPALLCRCIAMLRRHTLENGDTASAGKARFGAAHPAHKSTIIDADNSQAGLLLADTSHSDVLCSMLQAKLARAETLYCRCGNIDAAACCKVKAAENPCGRSVAAGCRAAGTLLAGLS